MHNVKDYLQEKFLFAQMLITVDKLKLEVKEEAEKDYVSSILLFLSIWLISVLICTNVGM